MRRTAGCRDCRTLQLLSPPLTNATMAVHMTSTLLSRTCGFSFIVMSCAYSTDSPLLCFLSLHLLCLFQLLTSPPITHRNPLGLPISKRDSLLEKCAMFREAGGTLSRQPSQDNGLDGPFSSGASKLEQVLCFLTAFTL